MPQRRSLMFNLGAFVGNVARGFTAPVKRDPPAAPPPAAPDATPNGPPRAVRTQVDEKVVDTPKGPVTLRRTVIDEVEPPPPSGR